MAADVKVAADGSASDAPLLHQLTPLNIKDAVDGKRTVFAAFVNPYLPESVAFHGILHRLNGEYKNRTANGGSEKVLIGFGDVTLHRNFAKQFGLRTFPAVRVFARTLPMKLPINIEYSANKTYTEYKNELDTILHMVDGYTTDAGHLADKVSALTRLAKEQELEAAKEMKKTLENSPAADDSAAAVAAAASSTHDGSANATVTPAELTQAALASLEAQLASQIKFIEKMADLSKKRLEFINSTLHAIADPKRGGLSYLARQLNLKTRAMAIGTDFLKADLREQGIMEVGFLKELLEEFV